MKLRIAKKVLGKATKGERVRGQTLREATKRFRKSKEYKACTQ
jgi:hypothetical protein